MVVGRDVERIEHTAIGGVAWFERHLLVLEVGAIVRDNGVTVFDLCYHRRFGFLRNIVIQFVENGWHAPIPS